MKKYTLIEHTADIRLLVEGDSLQELFLGALQGMASIISPKSCAGQNFPLTQKINLIAPDITVLLIDFLSHVLTLSHVYKATFCSVTFTTLTHNTLEAVIHGVVISSFNEDIKAVTYHEAQVVEKNRHLSTMIVFDI